MLSQIIDEFRKSSGLLDLNGLSQRLGVEKSALDGMLQLLVRQGKLRELQLLVRQGKLREIGLDTEACTHCAGHLSCASIQAGNVGKAYELVG